MPSYHVFGLSLDSDFTLSLPTAEPRPHHRVVRVTRSDLSSHAGRARAGLHIQRLDDGDVWCQVPSIASCLIHGDDLVLVDECRDATPASVQLLLLGSVLGIVLHRLGGLVLHGSAVRVGGSAVICVGPSGVGKSTIALAFSQAGHRLLSDDVSMVTFDEAGCATLVPGYPQMKLWRASLEMFGLADQGLSPVRGRSGKFALPAIELFEGAPVPIAGVFALDPTPAASGLSVTRVTQASAYPLIHNNTYRIETLQEIASPSAHFLSAARLLNLVPVYTVMRPAAGWDPRRMVDAIVGVLR